jgi:hypothetical protein
MAVGGKNLSRNNRTLSYDNIPELLTDSTTESADSEKLKTYGRTDNVNELKEEIAQLFYLRWAIPLCISTGL